ncbi:DUF4346 domain-containing protein [Candidatus Woesearchaeota archaeon]|nr:DUF4346 domain-containing protein [Candidatus Woesearchaeota archaeon]
MEEIDATGFEQKFVLDPNGYFLIRVLDGFIEVGHCLKSNVILTVVRGRTPEEVMYKVIDLELISLLDHAAYLGKELEKAYTCILTGKKYVQDSRP